jgi:DNA-binding transcriptional regulator LsrR (DeoR family)
MSTLNDLELIYRVARNYYINDYSQAKIAKLENLSRPQISRLLQKAKALGIVKIDIVPFKEPDILLMQEKLREILKLGEVLIVPSLKQGDNPNAFMAAAADFLSKRICEHKKVGVGWGQTIYNTSFLLTPIDTNPELTFYPIVGNSGINEPSYQINSIIDRFAEKFRAKATYTQCLFLAYADQIPNSVYDQISYLKSCWGYLDAAVVGLGGRIISSKIHIDEMPLHIRQKLLTEHTMGDLFGRFFMDDGTFLSYPDDLALTAIEPDTLRNMEQVYCVAAGRHKVDAIRFVSKNRYIKTLLTDEATAMLLLDSY